MLIKYTPEILTSLYGFTEEYLWSSVSLYRETISANQNEGLMIEETLEGFIEFIINNSNTLSKYDIEDIGFIEN